MKRSYTSGSTAEGAWPSPCRAAPPHLEERDRGDERQGASTAAAEEGEPRGEPLGTLLPQKLC